METTRTNVVVEKTTPANHLSDKFRVVKIQRTCVHDGPGIRTTVFFSGCGLRCLWCQNPESLLINDNPNAEDYSVDDIMQVVNRDKDYYDATNGGVTLSGGEPLLQNSNLLVELLSRLRKEKINTAVETTLNVPWEAVEKVIPYVDVFFVDIKTAGDEEQHRKLTGNDGKLIKENIEKLVETEAKINFRMVMVPGLNDTEDQIEKVSNLLKSVGYDRIELLKYNNMYEEKAVKFNLDIPKLNITEEQAETAIKHGLETFKKNGINAVYVKLNIIGRTATYTQRVLDIQQDIRDAGRALCMEVSKLKTRYYRKNGFDKPTPIHRSERLKYVLENKSVIVWPKELLVGNFTAKRCAGQVWEEQYGVLDVSFLYKINHQTPVSFKCPLKDRLYFYTRIMPFWIPHSLLLKVNTKISDFIAMLGRSSEMIAGFQNNMAAIAHFIPNYDRILELGTTGLIEELKQTAKEHPENNQDFYKGAIMGLEALANWADRYAAELKRLAGIEKDEKRRAELEKMAEICQRVPRYPARTFHEALQSIIFLQIAICQEAYENAVSFGRMDQILYPYYKADLDAGRITYDEAKELLCLFVLKMDECILVNDGDSLLNIAKLFETLSTDQALTFGGCDKDGNDATNDITYMFIDACELQPLAINMCARINKNSPDKYLERLAEIYINGCPMPEMFSDDIYLDAIPRKHDTTIENARNYAIVGCVEPLASDDHFGNTDSANVNVVLPMLQAIKGQKHDLWHYSNKQYLENVVTRFIEYAIAPKKKCPFLSAITRANDRAIEKRKVKRGMYKYNPPTSMEEILEAYQERLNELTISILLDQQKILAALEKNFTTPMASSLFRNCVATGKDAYEGGTFYRSHGIQAVGITDVADSLYAIDELVFKQKKYTLLEIIEAIDSNFEGSKNQKIREDILAIPKFGDDSCPEPAKWVTKAMEMFCNALDAVPNTDKYGVYTAGYYALNVNDRYGLKTQALPSGRLKGVPLANSTTPHYGMEESDLLSSLNAMAQVNFRDFAPNGTTATLHIDSALFPGEEGIKNLAALFKTFLTKGGMQFQPNVISREILIDAYNNPEKYKYLMVRVAGYCSYFNELSDDLKKVIINRTCYA
ncbi:MAG: radical SAM protein [Ruminococcaceae bacterium]|nr:radical SAM protein [Oscillospiraceae bacterium]